MSRFEIRTQSGRSVSLRSRQYAEFLAILTLAGPQGIELRSIGPEFFSEEWTDQKKAIRNLLSRTRRHLRTYSDIGLFSRDGEVASLIAGQCECDLWQLRKELDQPKSRVNYDEVERLLQTINGHFAASSFMSAISADLLKRLANDLLRAVELLASQPARPGLKGLASKIISIIKPQVEFSTDLTQRQLALYGKLRMRQEIIETLADYSDYLAEDLGDSMDRELERFAESLLLEMDRSDTSQFDIPTPPNSLLRIVSLDETSQVVLAHQNVFIGGLPGVGKSHLLKLLANSESVQHLNPAYVDLVEVSRPIQTAGLISRNPGVVFIDNYTEVDSMEVRRIQSVCPDAKLVIAGQTDVGIDVHERVTVTPLEIDTPASSRSAEALVRYLLGSKILPAQQIKELAHISHGMPSAVVRLLSLVDEFGPGLAIHEFSAARTDGASALVRPGAILESLRLFPPSCHSALKALVGFSHPVATTSLASCFELTVTDLRRLVSLGLIDFRKNEESFTVPPLVSQQLSQLSDFAPDNPWQTGFELWLVNKLSATPAPEASRVDTKGLQFVISNHKRRKEFRNALNGLVVQRPHLFVTQSCESDITGLDNELFNLDLEPDVCAECLLAIGAGLFYQQNFEMLASILGDPRWSKKLSAANHKLQAEVSSQLGIAQSTIGEPEAGVVSLERAVQLASINGLESVLVKVLYNLATALGRNGRLDEAVTQLDRAVDLLQYVPTVAGRLELLHMQASYRADLERSPEDTKRYFHIALSYAKTHGLDAEAGWIMLSLGGHCIQRGELINAVVALSAGIREHLSSELTPEARRRSSFSCDAIAHCLHELGSTALGYQGAILAHNIHDSYHTRDSGFQRLGISPIQLPEGLRQAKEVATGGDILLFLARVQLFLRQFPEAQEMFRSFGYLEEVSPTEPTGV